MVAAGMITEYNPLHRGHLRLAETVRRELGDGAAVIACMSGDFVQRGDFAVARRQARAKAAVMGGVDLVMELPLPWSLSSAEGFAEGGVSLLLATGCADVIAFGSETGDADALQEAASVLLREDFPAALRVELSDGVPFPVARQRAVRRLSGPAVADVLSRPNDILGVEYCKALLRRRSNVRPLAILREGAPHNSDAYPDSGVRPDTIPDFDARSDSGVCPDAFPSSGEIRAFLRRGERAAALSRMVPSMRACYLEEETAGRAPVFYATVERAILWRLRSMSRAEFAAFDEGREGLCNRLYEASRNAVSVREILERAKTKRYPLSRLRRMILRAALGVEVRAYRPAYLRPLAMNAVGRTLLSRMRTCAALPILTKAADVRELGPDAQALLDLEARAADLYALAYPEPAALSGGAVWKESPWIADDASAPNPASFGKELP